MIYIRKGSAPRSLVEYRSKPNANYNDFSGKADVINSLLNEQGYLCAYCMRRIGQGTAQIEHYFPQHPEEGSGELLALNYGNMLGVCDGLKGLPKKDQTCDQQKGNKILKKVNPLDVNSIDLIGYRDDGTIFSKDEETDKELNIRLNLNCRRAYFKENRRAAIMQLLLYLQKKHSQGTWNKALLEQAQRHFEEEKDGLKQEYLGAILYYIKHYLRKAQ